MKKVLILLSVFYASLYAKTAKEYYEIGQSFEQKGDFKRAMQYYKLSASMSENEVKNTSAKLANSSNTNSNESEVGSVSDDSYSQNTQSQNYNDDARDNGDDFAFLGLKRYEPIYMLGTYDFSKKSDRNQKELKFQISLQKPITYDLFGMKETIAFAYTQTSWWQIWEDSAPFRESNYKPEIFMEIPVENSALNSLKFGLLHESNGQGGENSRSWNKAYAQTNFKFGNLEITPRVWHSFGFDDTNKDIREYMGYGDLRASYKIANQKFYAMLRNNLKFDKDNKGAFEAGWMFPIYNGINGYVQYFTGYGESLIDYNKHVDKIGVGIAVMN